MALDRVRIGFLPLVDAALPILAREQGFAEAEGLEIELVRDMTWATVRDRLLYGHTDAAHLIAPLAIATTLGRGRPAVPLPLIRAPEDVTGMTQRVAALKVDGLPTLSSIRAMLAERLTGEQGGTALRKLERAAAVRRRRHPALRIGEESL